MKPDIKDCAPGANCVSWNSIDWKKVERSVKSLQRRIAKAIRDRKHSKAKSLQWILSHSFHAKLWAVKRVTKNKGKRTPGVDNIRWKSPKQKLSASKSLVRKNYKALPLRRLYILKKNGKKRPLGIPTLKDRAFQALHLLTLEPVSETLADKVRTGSGNSGAVTMLWKGALFIFLVKTVLLGFLKGTSKDVSTISATNG